MSLKLLRGLVLALLFTGVAWAADPADTRLQVRTTAEKVELEVPVGSLVLSFPKGGFAIVDEQRDGSQVHPRYFNLADSKRGLVISGWFEPVQNFPGYKEFWRGEFEAMKKTGLASGESIKVFESAPWMGVTFEYSLPKDLGNAVNTHIRAELTQADSWIDLHISLTTGAPLEEARRTAMEFLRSIVVTQKAAPQG